MLARCLAALVLFSGLGLASIRTEEASCRTVNFWCEGTPVGNVFYNEATVQKSANG